MDNSGAEQPMLVLVHRSGVNGDSQPHARVRAGSVRLAP